MSLRIDKASFLALIQDYGRYGLQSQGVTVGGPMDEHAFLWANRLLGNEFNAPQIEVTMGAFGGVFTKPTKIALCGADLGAKLNGAPIKPWQTYTVTSDDSIEFSHPHSGLRAYLAVKGGFTLDSQLGSVATVMREKLGGLGADGTKLAVGDLIAYQPNTKDPYVDRQVPKEFVPHYSNRITLRFFPNTSETGVSDSLIHSFTEREYVLSPQMDRMGYRLKGTPLEHEKQGIISQGISLGAIQLPPDGCPIVLMSDRQTIGGYPQIGCVARVDIAKLAQCSAGAQLNFVVSDPISLSHELTARQQFMETSC